jgi:hypothetical protein
MSFNILEFELNWTANWLINNPHEAVNEETLSGLVISDKCKQTILNDVAMFKIRMDEILQEDNQAKKSLNIPESLEKWFLANGWGEDYWKEIPPNWKEWSNKELKKYPITCEIWNWKKSL